MTRSPRRDLFIILILGALSTVSPISIDMYLPAFPQIAHDLGTTPAEISLSVSGYFIGLALGQLFYGPLLDRFGRKRPIYAGLSLFVVASLVFAGAATSSSPPTAASTGTDIVLDDNAKLQEVGEAQAGTERPLRMARR